MKFFFACVALSALIGCASVSPRSIPDEARPSRFSVSVGGAMGSAYDLQLDGERLRYTFYSEPFFRHRHVRSITPSHEAWVAFWREVQAVDLWRWRSSYKVPPPNVVFDGTQWHIDISYHGQSVSSSGDNAYPSDSNPTKTGTKVAEPTQRFLRFTGAVQRLIGGRNFE
jgi:hypothetical protein